MIDERLETQASLYALGALPADEAREFERSLPGNPELQQLVAEFREAAEAVLLTSPPVDPPPALKQKILARLESGAGSRSEIVPLDLPLRPAFNWLPWALAACLAVLCVITIYQRNGMRDQVKNGDISQLRVATMTSTNAEVVVVWNNFKQKGELRVIRLPAPPQGKDYQLWVLDPKIKTPVSAGVIPTGAAETATYAFTAVSPIGTPEKFAISLEPKGGSATPTEVILVSN